MKRRFIKETFRVKDYLVPIPEEKKDLIDYANRLNLLNDVPLTYLLTDTSDLPEESIRFGIVDINWTDAYIDGAFSIGRICGKDGTTDKNILRSYKKYCNTLKYLDTPRLKRMHPSHSIKRSLLLKSRMNQYEPLEDLSEISVVLIRSELVNLKKGIHFLGYQTSLSDQKDTDEQLKTLRIEKISNDIMICLFSGIIDKFVIEEPLTGLKFGCKYDNNNQRVIDIRSASEENFGEIKEIMPIGNWVEDSGRINVKDLSGQIGNLLSDKGWIDIAPATKKTAEFSPSRFAFEMLSIPRKYVFLAETQSENK